MVKGEALGIGKAKVISHWARRSVDVGVVGLAFGGLFGRLDRAEESRSPGRRDDRRKESRGGGRSGVGWRKEGKAVGYRP